MERAHAAGLAPGGMKEKPSRQIFALPSMSFARIGKVIKLVKTPALIDMRVPLRYTRFAA